MPRQSSTEREKFRIEIGQKFGRWTVVGVSDRRDSAGALRYFDCVCECGTKRSVRKVALNNGMSTSCGCWSREVTFKHGQYNTPLYRVWQAMRDRCNRETDIAYENYGGRGIKVCQRWSESFAAFWKDMGDRPDGHSIDRIDVNGDYEPGNCRWATTKEQARNRRDNRLIEHDGKTLTLIEWAETYQMDSATLWQRIAKGMDIESALTQPVRRNARDRLYLILKKKPGYLSKAITRYLSGESEESEFRDIIQRANAALEERLK